MKHLRWRAAATAALFAVLITSCLVVLAGDGETETPSVPRGEAAVLHTEGASFGASWMRPKDFHDMVRQADVAVRATVTDVAAGPPLTTIDPATETPTQRIKFVVDEQWYGRPLETFVLFKTGTQEAWIDDDPPYAVGEQYVMFIRPRTDDPTTYINVGPDGRQKIIDGHLRPVIDGDVARRLGGLSVADAKRTTLTVGRDQ
jgi:hypothetical protein